MQLRIEVSQLKSDFQKPAFYEQYKYADGYLQLFYKLPYEELWSFYGFITLEDLELKLGTEQFKRFLECEREFVI